MTTLWEMEFRYHPAVPLHDIGSDEYAVCSVGSCAMMCCRGIARDSTNIFTPEILETTLAMIRDPMDSWRHWGITRTL